MAGGSGGGGAGLGVIVGALVVVVAIIGVIAFSGGNFGNSGGKSIDVNVHTPNISAPAAPAKPG